MRKSKPKKRILLPDPKYHDPLVTRFVNNVMYSGNKSVAYDIFYDAIEKVEVKTKDSGKTPIEVWKKAMENITPAVEVKSRRVGGATFQIPSEIRPDRKVALTIKWLISYSRRRNEKSMAERLAAEIIAASKGEGSSVF